MTREIKLSLLGSRPMWAPWMNMPVPESKKFRKLAKAPWGRNAASTDPKHWVPRDRAEKHLSVLELPHGGGIGLRFASLSPEWNIGGIDLDTCRTDGMLAAWAENVIELIPSYTEISPSGSGVKIFFAYQSASLGLISKITGNQFSTYFKMGAPGEEHPPGIELHLGHRWFAFTGQHLVGSPEGIRFATEDALVRLVREVGPALRDQARQHPATQSAPFGVLKSKVPQDQTGSGIAFRVGVDAVLAGADFDEMVEKILASPEAERWGREKGEEHDQRGFQRIFRQGHKRRAYAFVKKSVAEGADLDTVLLLLQLMPNWSEVVAAHDREEFAFTALKHEYSRAQGYLHTRRMIEDGVLDGQRFADIRKLISADPIASTWLAEQPAVSAETMIEQIYERAPRSAPDVFDPI